MNKQTEQGGEEKGFTLIELMLVVVIMGILFGLGVPQYANFQKKARQSEVKTNLSTMFVAQKIFYSRWNQYYADFQAVGFSVSGDMVYHLGFAAAGIKGPKAHESSKYRDKAAVVTNTQKLCSMPGEECSINKAGTTKLVAGTIVNAEDYKFGGVSNLDEDVTLDEWYIDEKKQFTQVKNDITN